MTMSSTSSRLYIPAFGGIYAGLQSLVLPLLRAGLGIILIAHGCQKLFGLFGGMGLQANAALFERLGYVPGMFWGTLVGLTETIGGFLLVIGLFTRPAALSIVIFMMFAIHFTSAKGFFWSQGGMEFPLLILLVALVFLIRGGGEYSVDSRMAKEF
jgi:putative oxidoreductase